MSLLQWSDVGIVELGNTMPELLDGYRLWVTINPSTKIMHKCAIKKRNKNGKEITVICKIPYGRLPQRVQYEYCTRIIQRCYLPFLGDNVKLFGVPELTEQKNIHIHFLLKSDNIKNDTDLHLFRRDISLCDDVLQNTARSNGFDKMNHICLLNDTFQDRIKYMNKQQHEMLPHFKNFYIK